MVLWQCVWWRFYLNPILAKAPAQTNEHNRAKFGYHISLFHNINFQRELNGTCTACGFENPWNNTPLQMNLPILQFSLSLTLSPQCTSQQHCAYITIWKSFGNNAPLQRTLAIFCSDFHNTLNRNFTCTLHPCIFNVLHMHKNWLSGHIQYKIGLL